MKGLYVHIPFCEHICFYCDFAKRVPKDKAMMDAYLVHLKKDFDTLESDKKQYDTIYIGGGTPSLLDVDQLKTLFELFKQYRPIEYTIEVNPESYTHEKGLLFKAYGINRISLGVQSFEQPILDYIGRKHHNEQVFSAIESLKSIGITNISIDLIFAIPGQTMASIKHDLDMLEQLDIKHVSYYSLILEEKTVFHYKYLNNAFKKADIDLEADMYIYIQDRLEQQGFKQYEISNFAKDNLYSKHNHLYWTMAAYDAIGAGAHGFDGKTRYYNYRDLPQYYEKIRQGSYLETEESHLSDTLIFGLRTLQGVDIKDINARYSINLLEKYPDIKKYIDLGLVIIENNHLRLTKKGLLLGNQVFEVFV
ncbi:MAG: coproporphyrinogen III oxidase [Tenericutes bacterium HGW-Tenericutes-8]|nr:MAG: coproporphyrinogen III oxidase [Tenericutes bacterium HGW-Tenericutes-8]